ncbi:BC1872 family protein [Paenibacillus larvae]|uniref:Phage ABA sandwich domain-containing protein n=1 Tax=Paenibacillus larvae subsp. larvae TaxID=147375 RepID=A0A6C0QRF9_9BACL|nr:hypothetical protein [Paenibacillus larvae]QHZ51170.1 hypothetical protein ERICV_02022 [Paenibacillus larvae subsp. larvae]
MKHTRESIIAWWDGVNPKERDMKVAESVMDWRRVRCDYFSPSTSIADSWRVLEKLRGKWFVRIADFGRHGWGVELVSETAAIPYVSVTRETVTRSDMLSGVDCDIDRGG